MNPEKRSTYQKGYHEKGNSNENPTATNSSDIQNHNCACTRDKKEKNRTTNAASTREQWEVGNIVTILMHNKWCTESKGDGKHYGEDHSKLLE